MCYYYNGDCMDIKIDNIENQDLPEEKKAFNWKKFIIIILSIIFCFVLLIIYCRYKATTGLKVYEYKVTNSSLPDSFHGVKLVQFSDIYYGNTVDIKYLNHIVSSINNLKPDIVVFTGDLVINKIDDETKNKIIDSLSSIDASIGKYAIKGDADIDLFDSIIESSGFINLNNKTVDIFYKGDIPVSIGNQDISSDLFNILLIHEPDTFDDFTNEFELVLSGHSLNGQINIPIVKKLFLQKGAKKYYSGYYNVRNSSLYVSNGIGTTSFKYRLFNKPSVSLFRLTKY